MCNYQPELVTGPIGMFHCPECGKMVLAGYPHPDYENIDYSSLFDQPEGSTEIDPLF